MPEVRPIDANALKDKISNIKLRVKRPEMMAGLVEMKAAALREIENAPTIEAEPVRHGRWVDWSMWGESNYQCSECDCEMKYRTNYCPRCGAKMDGGADNG